jgi:ferritin-like metal-binding protein YciE
MEVEEGHVASFQEAAARLSNVIQTSQLDTSFEKSQKELHSAINRLGKTLDKVRLLPDAKSCH